MAQIFLLFTLALALKINRIGLTSVTSIPKDADEIYIWKSRYKQAKLILGLIFLQLVIGAAMRHEHAGLAVPDFPTAYGTLWPVVNRERLDVINEERAKRNWPPTSIAQIHLHMTHRFFAAVIALMIFMELMRNLKRQDRTQAVIPLWPALNKALAALVLLQVTLGALTVWSGKAALIATLHVIVGALLLCAAFGTLWLSRSVMQSIAIRS
jgi:heme A synthase